MKFQIVLHKFPVFESILEPKINRFNDKINYKNERIIKPLFNMD